MKSDMAHAETLGVFQFKVGVTVGAHKADYLLTSATVTAPSKHA